MIEFKTKHRIPEVWLAPCISAVFLAIGGRLTGDCSFCHYLAS